MRRIPCTFISLFSGCLFACLLILPACTSAPQPDADFPFTDEFQYGPVYSQPAEPAYEDFPFNVEALFVKLAKETGVENFGTPMRLGKSVFYLVPVGDGKRSREFSQIQGQSLRGINQFWPNPVRKDPIVYAGSYQNIVLYNDRDKSWGPLLAKNQPFGRFTLLTPERIGGQLPVVVLQDFGQNPADFAIIAVTKDTIFRPFGPAEKVLDWSASPQLKQIHALVHRDADGDGAWADDEPYETVQIPMEAIAAIPETDEAAENQR